MHHRVIEYSNMSDQIVHPVGVVIMSLATMDLGEHITI